VIHPAFALVDLGDNRIETLLVKTPRWASNVLPCQAKRLIASAISLLNTVPGAMIAVPLAEPSGIAPAALFVKRSSSSAWLIASSCATSNGIFSPRSERNR
jgi:hypothetical protein